MPNLPLFPLNTVVFVDSILQLQIFEQRYLNLVKNCMKSQQGFVVVLIRDGKEVDDIPETYNIGTYIEIIDWDSLSHNLLGITIQGKQRVKIKQQQIQDDNLITADVEYIDNLEMLEVNTLNDELFTLLQALHQHPFVYEKYPEINDLSSIEVAYKLAELLPASNRDKQSLLEIDQPRVLIEHLKALISNLETLTPDITAF